MAEPVCRFFGVEVPAGKNVQIIAGVDADMEGYEVVHLTQIALGAEPAKGPHTIFISTGEQKAAVGTLDAAHHPHIGVDYTVSLEGVTLSHTGRSSVYVSGYKTIASFMSSDGEGEDGGMDFSEDDSDIDSDFDSEEEDEEGAPAGVPLRPRLAAPAGPAGSDEDDSEEEGLSEGCDAEDEDDDEEEGAPVARGSGKQARARSAEQEATPAASKKAKTAMTPAATGKKATAAATAAAPAASPTATSSPSPAAVAEYVAALRAVLAEQGPQRVSTLGALVKRPPQVPKLKSTVSAHPAIFVHDLIKDVVSLVAE